MKTNKMKRIKILELFGGIGACSKALERLGFEIEIVDYVEIDKFAVSSFNAIHGTNFIPQDITKWDKDIKCDLIMHGSPCQDFSVAGFGRGGDIGSGTRSSLMYETLRIVEKIKPKYVIWENVKNLLSKKHKIRRLTPLECWRLMGFDDSDFEKAAKVNSNRQLYKQAGNSIVVNVLYYILNNLLGDNV